MPPATRSARSGTPPTLPGPAAAFLLAVALALPPVAAAAVAFGGQPHLQHEVRPSEHGTTFTFTAPFRLDADAQVYLKVVPAPNNPAYANGSADGGWWTRAAVSGPEADLQAESNGTTVMEFGGLRGNTTYVLRLDVTVPAGALSHPLRHELRYALAMRQGGGAGSGGQLDPSLSVNPSIVVSESAVQEVPAPARPVWQEPWALAAGAALVVAVAAVALRRRRPHAPQ